MGITIDKRFYRHELLKINKLNLIRPMENQFVRKRFKSYWDEPYNKWFSGVVVKWDFEKQQHKLKFDTGVIAYDNLATTKVKWVKIS